MAGEHQVFVDAVGDGAAPEGVDDGFGGDVGQPGCRAGIQLTREQQVVGGTVALLQRQLVFGAFLVALAEDGVVVLVEATLAVVFLVVLGGLMHELGTVAVAAAAAFGAADMTGAEADATVWAAVAFEGAFIVFCSSASSRLRAADIGFGGGGALAELPGTWPESAKAMARLVDGRKTMTSIGRLTRIGAIALESGAVPSIWLMNGTKKPIIAARIETMCAHSLHVSQAYAAAEKKPAGKAEKTTPGSNPTNVTKNKQTLSVFTESTCA